jgi:hypothetical protein
LETAGGETGPGDGGAITLGTEGGGAGGGGTAFVATGSFADSFAISFSSSIYSLIQTKTVTEGAATGFSSAGSEVSVFAVSADFLANSSFKDSAEMLSTVLEALLT